jgi:hypothetical protein
MLGRHTTTVDALSYFRQWLRVALTFAVMAMGQNATAAQTTFAAPEQAVAAMVDAVRLNNEPLMNVILGPGADSLIRSGDSAQDQRRRTSFLKAYDETHRLVGEGENKMVLHVGKDGWPMPIPLVKSRGTWRFDTQAGAKEILARRIGRNELAAIQVCLAIVDAQRDYAKRDIDGDGVLEYAAKIASTAGKHDGLYWEPVPGEEASPLGPFLAAAANEGYGHSPLAPYHGYFYRVLTRQGTNAPGGARDFIVRGNMIGGFAAIAYPARYAVSGVMSFIVSEDGIVFEKNLGNRTTMIAKKMTTYDPDSRWKRP